mmetsp:Transcript_11267/g.31273  ORF Transcript_11267/g.31273 Transcript_11267/m.31273 type:complete len:223 (-) Transcript_11267:363-1031(-)
MDASLSAFAASNACTPASRSDFTDETTRWLSNAACSLARLRRHLTTGSRLTSSTSSFMSATKSFSQKSECCSISVGCASSNSSFTRGVPCTRGGTRTPLACDAGGGSAVCTTSVGNVGSACNISALERRRCDADSTPSLSEDELSRSRLASSHSCSMAASEATGPSFAEPNSGVRLLSARAEVRDLAFGKFSPCLAPRTPQTSSSCNDSPFMRGKYLSQSAL